MLLAFDVGNTNIVCGVYKDRKLIRHWRVATDTLQTADGYAALLHGRLVKRLRRCVLSAESMGSNPIPVTKVKAPRFERIEALFA